MKKILFPLQKLALVYFFLQLLIGLDKVTYIVISTVLLGLSLWLEGARPYTPLLFLVVILEMFGFIIFQVFVIVVAGVAAVVLKLYEINVPIKGPFLMGHRYKNIQINGHNLLISMFYPTLTKTKSIQWIPKLRDYNKVLYEIFYVDPKIRRMPYKIFTFVNSYLHKIVMPVEQMSPYVNPNQPQYQSVQSQFKRNQQKLIIFSPGLGSHLNAYSSIFGNWTSQGYTVISVNHDHDQVCVNHRDVTTDDNHQAIKQYYYLKRNRDLKIRVKEVLEVVKLVQQQNFMKDCLGRQKTMKFKEIILAGHSYGGGTALAAKAQLNQIYKQKQKLQQFSKIICLDPWLFPFQQQMFDNLNNQNILIINSQYFYKEVPYIYDLQRLFSLLLKNNPSLDAFMIKRMDHISQCDMAYVFGNLLQITRTIKLSKFTDKFMALNIYICSLFLEGKKKQEIKEYATKFIEDKKMDLERVQIVQEYRITRQLTFGGKQTKQQHKVSDKL